MQVSALKYFTRTLALALALSMASLGLLSQPAMAATSSGASQINSQSSSASAPSSGAMAFDALVVRPVSLVGTLLGSVVFVASLPFSAIGGNVGQAGHRLVVEPGAFTFDRPLGDFSDTAPY